MVQDPQCTNLGGGGRRISALGTSRKVSVARESKQQYHSLNKKSVISEGTIGIRYGFFRGKRAMGPSWVGGRPSLASQRVGSGENRTANIYFHESCLWPWTCAECVNPPTMKIGLYG